jgi:predicted dehydrogenase
MLRALAGQLDAVVLVTPHTLHYTEARAALEAGINVLVEKPMVTSSEHAYDLWRTVERTGKKLAIAFQAPYSAEYRYLAAERDAGRLGLIQLVSGFSNQAWRHLSQNTWRQDPALSGGGFIYDTGAHLLNAMMWLMNDPVVEVGCFYDNLLTPVDIDAAIMVRFKSGAMGSIGMCGNGAVFHNQIVLQTDRLLVQTRAHGGELEITSAAGKIYPHVPELPEGMATAHANFTNALLGREPLLCGVRYGVLLSALMDALYESGKSGRIVKVKPVPEQLNPPD